MPRVSSRNVSQESSPRALLLKIERGNRPWSHRIVVLVELSERWTDFAYGRVRAPS